MNFNDFELAIYKRCQTIADVPEFVYPSTTTEPKGEYIGVSILPTESRTITIDGGTENVGVIRFDVGVRACSGNAKINEYINKLSEAFPIDTFLEEGEVRILIDGKPTIYTLPEDAHFIKSVEINYRVFC